MKVLAPGSFAYAHGVWAATGWVIDLEGRPPLTNDEVLALALTYIAAGCGLSFVRPLSEIEAPASAEAERETLAALAKARG